jgi:hypothetical protein
MTNLDTEVLAVCECGKEQKTKTYRSLKNKWPICSCKQPMKIKKDDRNADPNVPTTN